MGTTRRTAPHSTFRTVALIVSAIATILFLLCVAAVVRHVGTRRTSAGRGRLPRRQANHQLGPSERARRRTSSDGRPTSRVERRPQPHASGGRTLRSKPSAATLDYHLTSAARASNRRLRSARLQPRSAMLRRLSVFDLINAFVWFLLATMIALFRPELAVVSQRVRSGTLDGLVRMRKLPRRSALPWLPDWWRTAVLLTFPWYPLHLAVGYDFYSRFPLAYRRRGCGEGSASGSIPPAPSCSCSETWLMSPIDIVAPDRAASVRSALLPIDRWPLWPGGLLMPFAGVAIVAVVIRNYRAVQREDDRRRLRWVLWGTVLGSDAVSRVSAQSPCDADCGDAVQRRTMEPSRESRDRDDSDQYGLRDHQTPRLRHHLRGPAWTAVSPREECAATSCWRCRLQVWPTACSCIVTSRSASCCGPGRRICI